MFPSNYGIQDPNLFLFSDNIYTNPSSTNQDFSSPPLLNIFPSSHVINFNNEAVFLQDFHDVFYQKNDDQEMETHEGASNTNTSKIAEDDDIYSNKNSNVEKNKLSCGGSSKLHDEQIRMKRRGKKDRHSKITTANGCSRGRRMRLSLDVAKEFFGLQDMLGYDKASKTVEWLLIKSENAIKEETKRRLSGMNHIPCPSTTSVLPATDELESEAKTTEKTKQGTQKIGSSHPLTRGSREKARARARERTQEKKRLQLVDGFTDNVRLRVSNCSQRMNIGSDDPLLSWEKSAAVGNKFLNMNYSSDPAPALEVEDILNYSKQQPHNFKGSTNTEELIIDDHSFFLSDNWNPYNIFNLDHNSGTTS